MQLPTVITHYYEEEYGPFLNLCDLGREEILALTEKEKHAATAFNRFAMGEEFLEWRRAADDLLIRAYTEKFGFAPAGRPFYALLGVFDKTLTMFRDGRKITMEAADFSEHELTFMYPDHAHLVSFHEVDVPRLFYQVPEGEIREPFWGELLTWRELAGGYASLGIQPKIEAHLAADGWAGCYVEAHLWRRSLREIWASS